MTIATSTDTKTLLLDVSNTTLNVTLEQFDRLCIDNPDLRLELTTDRQLILYSNPKSVTGASFILDKAFR